MPDQPSSTDPLAAFGPNEWLVDELYQQYLQDKDSVDRAWWEFFEDYQPGETRANGGHGDRHRLRGHHAGPRSARRAAGPRGRSARREAGRRAAARRDAAQAAAPARRRSRPRSPPSGPPRRPRASRAARPPRRSRVTRPPSGRTGPVNEGEVKPLRGASARVVTNMESSLQVPTATSVRAVPAKLLIDNRVVINNHLARSRGGKVSFTHIIGYAMVKALASMPEMNNGFGESDGKPALVVPAHVNLGLAIDLAKPDGTRALLVPEHQGRRDDGLRPVLDGLRGRRAQGARQQADRRGLRRHHDQPDQPRHHRHRPLGPAPDAGPGRDHRRRRDGVPRRVAGRQPGDAQPQRRQQDPDAHLDLRPPDHPGRAVRATSCGSSTSCCSARTASTTRSSSRCGSPTSRSAGSGTSPRATTTTSTRPRGCRS